MEIEGKVIQIFVLKRPGAEEFIRKVSEYYEVVIYTASMSRYANPLLDKLDPKHYVPHRLFREHCIFVGTAFVKDLSLLGRDLKDVIIVDNSPGSYAFQPFNAIPISTWINDKSDKELFELIPVLEMLVTVPDVRMYLKKIVRNDQINYAQALKALKAELKSTQKPVPAETKITLINSWIPQQGKLTVQYPERYPPSNQQSQLNYKESAKPVKEKSTTAHLASTYKQTRNSSFIINRR